MFVCDNPLPIIFFNDIQTSTLGKRLCLEPGYYSKGYNPLTLNPFTIKKVPHKPKPLGPIIARS